MSFKTMAIIETVVYVAFAVVAFICLLLYVGIIDETIGVVLHAIFGK